MSREGLNISKVLIKVLSWKPLAGGAAFWVPVVGVLPPAPSQPLLRHGALPWQPDVPRGPVQPLKNWKIKHSRFQEFSYQVPAPAAAAFGVLAARRYLKTAVNLLFLPPGLSAQPERLEDFSV